MQRTEVPLHMGEEVSPGTSSMTFANAQEQWWVEDGNTFTCLGWITVFTNNKNVYVQGAAGYRHAHTSVVASQMLNTALKALDYPEL